MSLSGSWRRLLPVAALAAAGCASACAKPAEPVPAHGGPRTVPVGVAPVVSRAMPVELSTFGTARSEAQVAIKSQVSQVLEQVHFQKGDQVHAGDVLFTIQSRPFQVALQQAQAALARDRAHAEDTRIEARRQADLLRNHIATQAEYDRALAAAEAATQTLAVDQAQVEEAQLQLGYCQIRAPITGRAGDLLIAAGSLLKANDQPLVTINQISPIDVFFAVPQAQLGLLRGHLASGPLEVEAWLPDDPQHTERGRVTFVDNQVDPTTGTVTVGASFPNPDERLWPGLYVHVRVVLTVQEGAVVAPSAAVQLGQGGRFVFVVRPDHTVEKRAIEVDREAGEQTVVRSGLRPGETVVVDGQLRLVDGAQVEVVQPEEPSQP